MTCILGNHVRHHVAWRARGHGSTAWRISLSIESGGISEGTPLQKRQNLHLLITDLRICEDSRICRSLAASGIVFFRTRRWRALTIRDTPTAWPICPSPVRQITLEGGRGRHRSLTRSASSATTRPSPSRTDCYRLLPCFE